MRAIAVSPGARKVSLVDQPEPRLEDTHDVKLRILEVGVCGTDREICAFDYGTPPPGSDHLVIGHESLGEVIEVGRDVSRVAAGDIVVPTVRRPCHHRECRPCQVGRQDFCSTGEFQERGIRERHGFMTERIVDHESYMNVVPRALRASAVLVEPLTIAEKSLLQLAQIQDRLAWGCAHSRTEGPGHCHRAVVLGAGPVGLLGAMALAVRGFQTTVYSREPATHAKADLVRSFGGSYVSASTHDVDALASAVGTIDLVYEATGISRLAFEVLRHLGANGVLVLTGVPALRGPSPVDTDAIMRNMVLKNQLVLGTVNSGRDGFEAAIADLGTFDARWPQALSGLITGRVPVESYSELLTGPLQGIKNVIAFDGRR